MFSMQDVVDVEALRNKVNNVHEKFDSVLKEVGVKGNFSYEEGDDVVAVVSMTLSLC